MVLLNRWPRGWAKRNLKQEPAHVQEDRKSREGQLLRNEGQSVDRGYQRTLEGRGRPGPILRSQDGDVRCQETEVGRIQESGSPLSDELVRRLLKKDLEEWTVIEQREAEAAADAEATPEDKPAKKAKAAKVKPTKKSDGKLSGLDAAAKVLGENGEPMKCADMVEQMLSQGYWSTNGATPAATPGLLFQTLQTNRLQIAWQTWLPTARRGRLFINDLKDGFQWRS